MSVRLELTGQESARDLVKQLVRLRIHARHTVKVREMLRRARETAHPSRLEEIDEMLLSIKFDEIAIGRYTISLCSAIDLLVEPEALFDALNVNRAHRDTEDVRKYGRKASVLIFVLDLENSATKDDGLEIRPLKWCHTLAFMNALKTSDKFDRIVHEGANEFFPGVFGEYQERPLLERLTGQSA